MAEETKGLANLAEAVIKVMKEVKGIEKSMTVGSGNYTYKGMSDKDVKIVFNEAMAKHGLCLLPTYVDAKVDIHRWDEEDPYSKSIPKATKQKQSVFTEVNTKYLLIHTSGESLELAGYGHGQDSMDKSSGKAQTYALKGLLLYAFMTPTGHIDDTDNTHSEEQQAPQKSQSNQPPKQKPVMTQEQFDGAMKLTDVATLKKGLAYYQMTTDQENSLLVRIADIEKGV